jgi:hypothetical protein
MTKALYALLGLLIILAFLFLFPVVSFGFLPSTLLGPLQFLMMLGVLYFALRSQPDVRDLAVGAAAAMALLPETVRVLSLLGIGKAPGPLTALAFVVVLGLPMVIAKACQRHWLASGLAVAPLVAIASIVGSYFL